EVKRAECSNRGKLAQAELILEMRLDESGDAIEAQTIEAAPAADRLASAKSSGEDAAVEAAEQDVPLDIGERDRPAGCRAKPRRDGRDDGIAPAVIVVELGV